MMDSPALSLCGKSGQGKSDRHGFTRPQLSQELGTQAGVEGTDAEFHEFFWRKSMFRKESEAQIASGIDISRIVHMVVGVHV